MLKRLKMAKPESVHFAIINDKPCFYTYLALKWRREKGKEDTYDKKDLERVAVQKFEIEQHKKKYQDKPFWWEVVEENNCWKLRYFPTIADETLGFGSDNTHDIKTILQFLSG